MSWLPDFLSPLSGAIAAAVVVPLLLALYFLKLRRQERVISSTLLWRKAIQDLQVNAPFQRLRRNLLLLLQLLVLILACLALARPLVKTAPRAGKLNVILIDRSASMSATDMPGGSRLDIAKKRAGDLLSTLPRDASAMVIAFNDSAQIVQSFTTDTLALRRAIESIEPTDRPSRLKLAYQLAEARSAFFVPEQNRATAPPPDIWLYSDGRVLDSGDLRIRGNVHFMPLGSETAGNVGVVALSAKRNYERPTEVQVFARLANFGPEPVDADVQLSIGQQILRVAGTSLAPERWHDPAWVKAHPGARDESFVPRDSVEFTFELDGAAVLTLRQMHTAGDTLPADDAAHIVIPPPKPLRVLLVSEGNYFLEQAMKSLHAQSTTPSAYESSADAGSLRFDVIIFDRYRPRRLPGSGGFVWLGAVPPGTPLDAPAGQALAMTGEQGVLDWKRDHPIVRHLSLSKLYIKDAFRPNLTLQTETLVDGDRGPLVVMYREPRSTHLVVTFDVLESNWPLRVSFPVFLHNALQFLAMGSEMDLRQSYPPGASPRIPRTVLDQSAVRQLALDGPLRAQLPVPTTGELALPSLDHVGIYQLQPPLPPYDTFAVNMLNANESNLLPAAAPPGGMGEVATASAMQSPLELWWWLLAAGALPMLLIEWWVYTRRVHL